MIWKLKWQTRNIPTIIEILSIFNRSPNSTTKYIHEKNSKSYFWENQKKNLVSRISFRFLKFLLSIHFLFVFQVLASKEAHAQGLKRRLGITRWREFSEDMTQGLKNLQDSQAYKQAGEAVGSAKAKTASVWSSISNSQSFISASQKMGSAFGAAKTKVTTSFSSQNLASSFSSQNLGNLLKDIDNKTVRSLGFLRLHPLFTYVLFSVTHFYRVFFVRSKLTTDFVRFTKITQNVLKFKTCKTCLTCLTNFRTIWVNMIKWVVVFCVIWWQNMLLWQSGLKLQNGNQIR